MKSLYVVCYDISNDKARTKVEKLVSGYGKRIQYSLFECILTIEKKKELAGKLTELCEKTRFDPETDSIRIYRMCEFCRGEICKIGIDRSINESCMVI